MEVSKLLIELNEDFFKSIDSNKALPKAREIDPHVLQTKWLGYPPATPETIADKEHQLGISLPKSYKDFLLVSNGFRDISPFIFNLYSIEMIDWTKNIENEWWLKGIESDPVEMSDAEYLVYGDTQRSSWFRGEYFRNSLKISDWGDACCLFLNPVIKHEDEWEVLFYATWFPGTERHRSFKEFLIHTHKTNQELFGET